MAILSTTVQVITVICGMTVENLKDKNLTEDLLF